MAAKLIVRSSSGRVTEFPLVKDETKIGRVSHRNDLIVDDLAVSREHAAIRKQGLDWVLHDLKSANGTLVNGEWVDGPRLLRQGDLISLGKTECQFEVEAAQKKSDTTGQVRFGEIHDVDGTVMVSVVPEELLSLLKETAVAPSVSSASLRPVEVATAPGAAAPPEADDLKRLQKKARILGLLYELGRTLGTAFSLPEIYKKASQMLFSVTPADHCLILLKSPVTGLLEPVSVEVSDSFKARGFTGRDIVISRTITGRVTKEGIALLVYDAQKDFGSESIMMQAIQSVMCAPLLGTQGLLGIVYVDRRDMLSRFEEEDLDLLSAISSQTAIAIENTLTREQLQREAAVRERLGRFLTAGVVERVLKGEIKLGGVSQEVTTLFADIRGFTPLSERTSPEGVVDILNEHFGLMTEAILENGGTLDKYIGDSVMALFGAPDSDPANDPVHAVSAALEMQRAMSKVNAKLSQRGLPTIAIGVGIHTGRVVVGEIGSERQMNYTAIGDAVNLAARLESNAAPGQILVSADTAKRLGDGFTVRPLPPIRVKGKAEPVPVFDVAWQ
jgi:adenylate cyclase